MKDDLGYSLVLIRGKKDGLPIDLIKLTKVSNKDNLVYSLKDIDCFTSNITEEELINKLLEGNYIDINEVFNRKDNNMDYNSSLSRIGIIYYENGRSRVLPDGPCYIDNSYFLNIDNLYKYIMDNINNSQIINKLYNSLVKFGNDKATKSFIDLLNYSIKITKSNDEIKIQAAKELIHEYLYNLYLNSYFSYRKIAMYIATKMVSKDNPNKVYIKDDKNE